MQYKLYQKTSYLQPEDAIVAKALDMCKHLNIHKYYEDLRNALKLSMVEENFTTLEQNLCQNYYLHFLKLSLFIRIQLV